ncbi:MAG: anaerobic ribonucleoside-triphosphate reductase activating protein [Clostridia bacterium]|jgi:anaerobic ribonucleoside-triphosphate reductase activating protein|nr:anaerobic ribonucleoside-triphosphate reductase activating protein [Clostridia bacterium]MBQ1375476.1 anaerobic ribonucleoside-triphosphate reductase activating protein [Clostridia bacterium]MBQ1435417.1 anaerobic ribonucleoside-triphosphate reductase activating protein [Clostridia bacterium]MBQ4249321.1 anaerobic ribonucleoside-triphosphate reductase activating protein [Clostridia bacterium]
MDSNVEMIRIAGIVGDSITDGPGLRVAVFVQGCPHHCEGCHNPTTHDFSGGTPMSVDEIYNIIKKNPIIKGVTFSGGEPFCQASPLASLAARLKRDGLELAVYSGYTFEELIKLSESDAGVMELLKLCDTLIDGRFVLSQRSLSIRFRGSKNQRIIDVKKSLEAGQAVPDTTERWNG